MTIQSHTPSLFPRAQAGFSIMELLIAMGVMTVIMGVAFALLGRSLHFANTTYHMTEAQQTLRTAHEIINRDLTTAGDGLRGMNTIRVPVAFVQDYLTRTPIVDSITPNYPNLGLMTSDDNVPGSIGVPQTNPSKTVLSTSDRTSMLVQDRSFAPVSLLAGRITYSGSTTNIVVPTGSLSQFQGGEIYAVVSGSSVAFGVISSINTGSSTLVLNNGDLFGINQTGANSPIYTVGQINPTTQASTTAATIIRLQIIHYFVTHDKLLVRRVFGVKGAPFVDSVIAEHVAGLQFRYFLSTRDANGFVSQPVAQLSLANQAGVRQVEATVTVETTRAVNNINSGNGGHQLISSTMATTVRNLQFREAT